MGILWTILIGFLAGLLARAILPGKQPMGFILTTILGVVGSLLATYLGQAMGWYTAGAGAGFIASIVGAIVVLVIYGMVVSRRAT
ncbi:MAG: GlsB/YeaQ/YmgE family stress response membrane protein [Pseudomonadota bacterium]